MDRIKIDRAEGMTSYKLSSLVARLKAEHFSKQTGTSYRALKAVLRVLADHYPNVFPSVKLIGDKAGYGETQTKIVLRGLETDKYILDISGKKGGRGNSVQYVLDINKIVNPTVCVEFVESKPGIPEDETGHFLTGNSALSATKPDTMCRGTEKGTENKTEKGNKGTIVLESKTTSQGGIKALLRAVRKRSGTVSSKHLTAITSEIEANDWTNVEIEKATNRILDNLDDWEMKQAGDRLSTGLAAEIALERENAEESARQQELISVATERARQGVERALRELGSEGIEEHL